MSVTGSSDAIRKTVVVRCGVETAFHTWTEQINIWWPKGHSRSGDPATTVLMECQMDGRLYERTPEGVEHEWGKIVVWNPPTHFAYDWYLGSGVEQPTRVDVHFQAHQNGGTGIEVNHRGSEFIGELWSRNNARYDAAWEHVLSAYVAACDTL